jgi:hypothetical protein
MSREDTNRVTELIEGGGALGLIGGRRVRSDAARDKVLRRLPRQAHNLRWRADSHVVDAAVLGHLAPMVARWA